MSAASVVTRFAPSPTGELHLGNARTALFNFLLARRSPGGKFLLRIEDTDRERSRPQHGEQLLADLRWLGLQWDAEPLFQSQRNEIYSRELSRLVAAGRAYPCFCTVRELELARAAQLSSGKPPRYNGRCRALPPGQRAARLAAGDSATLRFAVPDSGVVEFTDLVHGPRSFLCADIGDFVLQRADGTASFFFSNAVDDSLSNVTQVLRGDDHLTNTPRQLLILSALAMPAPQYGHLALLTGASGAPLSKRAGDASLRGLQTEGFLPEALCNHLFRLGHSTPVPGVLDFDAMAAAFDTGHLQRAPAHFDSTQLMTWQRESVHRLSLPAAENWLSSRLPPTLVGDQRGYFIQAVLPNLLRPDDVLPWIDIVLQDQPAIDAEAAAILASADRRLFSAAAAAAADNDFGRISAAVREATGLRGPALFKPLRAALTGRLSGPELAPLLRAMAPGAAQQRLTRFA